MFDTYAKPYVAHVSQKPTNGARGSTQHPTWEPVGLPHGALRLLPRSSETCFTLRAASKIPIHVVVCGCSLFLAFVHFSTLGLALEHNGLICYLVRRRSGCFRCGGQKEPCCGAFSRRLRRCGAGVGVSVFRIARLHVALRWLSLRWSTIHPAHGSPDFLIFPNLVIAKCSFSYA